MTKKVDLPLITSEGVEIVSAYESPCPGLVAVRDNDSEQWDLIHSYSGLRLGRFRTRAVAFRAADLHNEIECDFTLPSEEIARLADAEMIDVCSVAACAIAIAEDEISRRK